MAGLVVRTGSEPEPEPVELDQMVRFRVWSAPPDLTSVRFEVLVFQSKNRTEPDYGNTSIVKSEKGKILPEGAGLTGEVFL
jgi:hypothetical protein